MGMRLWECRYTRETKQFVDQCRSYLWSTKPPTIKSIRRHWNKVHPGTYQTISDFNTTMVEDPHALIAKKSNGFSILERVTKEN